MKSRVLLVHGLWMRAPALLFWRKQLRAAGYQPEFFSYPSLLQSPETAMQRLRDVALAQPNTHILAHSLGGLLAVKALANSPEYNGKIICVGSPLAGSQVVRQIAHSSLSKLIGRSMPMLLQGLQEIPEGLHVCAIAGVNPHGLGRLVNTFSEPNDGTVALSETKVLGLAQHVQVHASHSGQLLSTEVMQKVIGILSQ
jgi:pimeloyl-ACP methyl ester carboxylesterase